MGSGVLISAGWYDLADVPASTFDTVTRPFAAEAFATGLPSPADAPGPSALLSFDDGSVWIAGGAGRNQLWRVPADQDGAAVGNAFATLLHPIYALAKDAQVRIWAATGGGPLLQLDPLSGAVLAEHGAGVGLAVAVSPIDGSIVVSAQDGLHRFDPATGDFALISRDRDLRVGSLAFADDGTLWGVTWPDRARVIRLGPDGRAQTVHLSDAPLDSLAFGRKGTVLENLHFVSANAGADTGAGRVSGGGLLLIDPGSGMVARLGRDGTRGDTLAALPDGRMIVSQSGQVDVIMPVFAPEIVATRPADVALAVAPLAFVEVEFDQRLLLSDPSDSRSVLNPANYRLTDSAGTSAAPDFVVYFEAERRAFLAFGALGRDTYTLTVSGVANIYNVPLPAPYEVSFEHILDILTLIDLDITQTRLDRDSGQVSFEVQLTNTSNRPIRLPVLLTLDPEGRLGLPDAFDGRADDGRFLIELTDALPPDGVLQPGASSVTRTIGLVSENRAWVDFAVGAVGDTGPNLPPVILSDAPEAALTRGEVFEYQIEAQDPEAGSVLFALFAAPPGMTVDGLTGLLRWDVPFDAAELNPVVVQVFDDLGAAMLHWFELTVSQGNRPPLFGNVPTELVLTEGVPFALQVFATDPDGDAVVFFADRLPPGARFDAARGVLSWIPSRWPMYSVVRLPRPSPPHLVGRAW